MRRFFKFLLIIVIALVLFLSLLSFRVVPENIVYGVSFSKFHSDELGLPWKTVYLALLDDLKVRNFRLSAHWPGTEPKEGMYDFSVLDFQMQQAKLRDAGVIFAVGERLPGWPECHVPDWASKLDTATRQEKIFDYITTVVNRYKNYPNITYWQVENEPFLSVFARQTCEPLDTAFFGKEIALVKKLDPARQVLVTDSGELGVWYGAHKAGDVFGSSLYLYVDSPIFGKIRYPITPAYYRIRENVADIIAGKKKDILSELGLEPWLLHPIVDTSISDQLSRMDINKFNTIISFAKTTGFGEQYLWGAEWWYYMKQNGHPEFWDGAKEVFTGK
ncbi:MAG: beta-galactosidase [Candidatus Pacebacteria bacterium]|nr:beta-galactosidase [Candidatus Paceibacterota bacterium]